MLISLGLLSEQRPFIQTLLFSSQFCLPYTYFEINGLGAEKLRNFKKQNVCAIWVTDGLFQVTEYTKVGIYR